MTPRALLLFLLLSLPSCAAAPADQRPDRRFIVKLAEDEKEGACIAKMFTLQGRLVAIFITRLWTCT